MKGTFLDNMISGHLFSQSPQNNNGTFSTLYVESLSFMSRRNLWPRASKMSKAELYYQTVKVKVKACKVQDPAWLTGDKKVFLWCFKLWSSNMSTIILNSSPSWTPLMHHLLAATSPLLAMLVMREVHPAFPLDKSGRWSTRLAESM